MARISRFWLLAMLTAIAVVGGMLLAPDVEASAAESAERAAPALESQPSSISAPSVPDGEFLQAAPLPVESVSPEPEQQSEPIAGSVDRSGLTLTSRSEFENEFVNADGAKVVQLSAEPLNARSSRGEWTEVKPDFHNSADGWMVEAHPLAPRFENIGSDRRRLVIERDGHEVSFSLVGSGAGRMESPFWFWDDWSSMAFRDVADGEDVEFELTKASVKDSVVLKAPPPKTRNTWTWRIDAEDLDLRLTDDDVLEFVDHAGDVVLVSPTPVAWDSAPTEHDGERNEIVLDAGLSRAADGTWLYAVTADTEWLQSKERMFPITIDPSVTLGLYVKNSYKSNGAQFIDQLHVGNTQEVANGYWWRAVENIAGGASVGTLIEGTSLRLSYAGFSTAASSGNVRVATGWCYTCWSTLLSSYSLGSGTTYAESETFQKYVAGQFGAGATNIALLISGGESSAYTHKALTSDLWIQYHPHVKPTVITGAGASPADGATGVTLTPTFKSTATAVAGSSLVYSFKIGQDAAFTPSLMAYESPETTSSQVVVPEGTLKPGTKYYWRAYIRDLGWDAHLGQSTWRSTGAWSFTTNIFAPTLL